LSTLGSENSKLTPELLLRAYAAGIFPMAKSQNDTDYFWVNPKIRGILPLEAFHTPRRLSKTIRKGIFDMRYDTAFLEVLKLCGEPTQTRQETWINPLIEDAVIKLFKMGHAHSVETWHKGKLVGGLYGIALGGAFFGESMFSRFRDASKVALVHLVSRLRSGGFILLDIQFLTDHLGQFGAKEITDQEYIQSLNKALQIQGKFYFNYEQ
tara:strand:- start:261 stop:890 length:630 start_codon:yes stop_codon:yes gene_type:complete